MPSDAGIDQELLRLLNTKRSPFKKYPEVFLNVIGLSQSWDDDSCRPTFLWPTEEGGLLDAFFHLIKCTR